MTDKGMVIVERNFRSRTGEIDIIAKDKKYLVFTEVKYRTGTSYGEAESAVDFRKQDTICRVSDFYCKKRGISFDYPRRFDVAAIKADKQGNVALRYIDNAFSYIPAVNRRSNICRMF